jgi:hypothetical protein
MQIQNNNDLLNFLVSKADSGVKNWFNFQEQKITGINAVYEIAKQHADKMTPDEVVDYVVQLNNAIYSKFFKVK